MPGGDANQAMGKSKGKIYPYVAGTNVNTYIKGVELYFKLNKTPDADKSLEFLTHVGQTPMDKLIESFKPDEVDEKSYDQVKEKFKKLFAVQVNPFGQRYRLVTRKQQEGETLDDFAIEIRNLVENTETDAETAEVLVDSIFVAGIRDQRIREGMLKDALVSDNLDQLLEKAKLLESAMKEAKFMEGPSYGA